jgi:hypothetical protein
MFLLERIKTGGWLVVIAEINGQLAGCAYLQKIAKLPRPGRLKPGIWLHHALPSEADGQTLKLVQCIEESASGRLNRKWNSISCQVFKPNKIWQTTLGVDSVPPK